jgi:hypothetical protein
MLLLYLEHTAKMEVSILQRKCENADGVDFNVTYS